MIFCRMTPDQKEAIVDMIQIYSKSTVLAVGDGSNDVAMIQKAKVGVGIIGKEGNTAGNYFFPESSINSIFTNKIKQILPM